MMGESAGDLENFLIHFKNRVISKAGCFASPGMLKPTAQARRWFAAHLSQTFALLTTPFSRS